ncbi:MAG: hypothetical protein R3190_15415, partial [Thermoanaerobaculia bacterium]|nr:hypothetical protein [Thermoanaerobaculia bacterium]
HSFDPHRYAGIEVPVLHLLGTESAEQFHVVPDALEPVVRGFRREALPGQSHFANVFAPELFAGKVLAFLDSVD